MNRQFHCLCVGAVGCTLALLFPAATAAQTESVIYSFKGGNTDGAYPYASLIDVKGSLYGTTGSGGANDDGAVFSVDPKTGAETVVYSFCSQANCTDGADPYASLIDVKGTLYGITSFGGANRYGTVFSVDPMTGAETVVYSFCGQSNCTDGANPAASLIDVKGMLYGTTSSGGANCTSNSPPGCGTVFSVDPRTGAETVVYSFCGQSNCTDGEGPAASLIDVKGTLYGTTFNGGADVSGTVFAVDPKTGTETVVYPFCRRSNCADGANPAASLIDVKGMLYGTTVNGGANGVYEYYGGAVFSVNPETGAETVVYSFCGQSNCADGSNPYASLINVKGALYGTTESGGANDYGTVFSVDPKSGAEAVVYSFCGRSNCSDGAEPYASLIDVKGTLYGTTNIGGVNGYGTLFAITKP